MTRHVEPGTLRRTSRDRFDGLIAVGCSAAFVALLAHWIWRAVVG